MPKRPKFSELPESEFNNDSIPVASSSMGSGKPARGSRPSTQSEESKAIKAMNMQIKNLYMWIPGEDNTYIHAWKKAVDESDMEIEYKYVNGEKVFVIRNTIHNRMNIDKLRLLLHEYNAKSKTDIRNQAKEELRAQGKKLNKENIDAQLDIMSAFATLQSNLDFVYFKDPNGRGKLHKYADMLRGYSRNADPQGYAQTVLKIAREVGEQRRNERKQATADMVKKSAKINTSKPY